MKNAYVIIHQGFGDLFNSVGIIDYYSNIYDKVNILVLDEDRQIIMNKFFENNKKIDCIVPSFCDFNHSNHPNTCVMCMTNGSNNKCPRICNLKCKYIDYNNYNGDIIKIGSFNNYSIWETYKSKQFSFADAFYTYINLDTKIRFENFNIHNNKDVENNTYDNFIKKYGSDYILIHEDNERHLLIDKNKIVHKNLPIINLNKISNIFVDYIKIIKCAKEIHLIDSSWSVLIYLLSYKEINNPIFFNDTEFKKRMRDTNIYKNPIFNNWTFY
jgi:hypothetical protein